jgi:hypothetical protein
MKTPIDNNEATDRRRSAWLGRVGRLGFAVFFLKGMAWLMLPAALWLID